MENPISEQNTYISYRICRSQVDTSLEPPRLLTSVNGTGRYSAHHQRRKGKNTKPAENPSIYNGDCLKDALV